MVPESKTNIFYNIAEQIFLVYKKHGVKFIVCMGIAMILSKLHTFRNTCMCVFILICY